MRKGTGRRNIKQYKRERRRYRCRKIKYMIILTAAVLLAAVCLYRHWEVSFWEKLSVAESKVEGNAYPEALLEALEKNPELEEFVRDYPKAEKAPQGGITKKELSGGVPLLLQYDKRWGYVPYGDDNIALSGCAPTCLSMVITGLTGKDDSPPDVVADFCMENGYYQQGVGTMWSLMTEGCQQFGLQGEEIALDENVIASRLEAGEPVICSMRPGDFTTSGHFIVLTGIEEGRLSVKDPFSRERSSRLWEYETLKYQIKNLWAFTKL